MVTFVDYYATSFIAFVPAMFELIAVFYAYGKLLVNQNVQSLSLLYLH